MNENNQLKGDLVVVRALNGVKLIQPDAVQKGQVSHAINSLEQLPFSVYFLNTEGATQYINHEGARVCGFATPDHSLGKTLLDVTKSESAHRLIQNCSEVIASDLTKIFEEENQRKDDVSLQFLSIKAPWYNEAGQVIGIMGCSIVMGQHPLSESLSMIQGLGLLDVSQQNKEKPPVRVNNINLSKREFECLELTVRGYTAKRIAKELAISHRTVEEYITNIRVKAGAESKAALIEMTIENFYLD
tara:strand:- start:1177 stop:1911 length:735 start_codon:yes stop_codon:yes gene_type:complete